MLKISFQDFYECRYKEDDDHELYVVVKGREILYIGISKRNIWNRWFGNFGRMQKREDGNFRYTDLVSREIVENIPNSLEWNILLLSPKECVEICKREFAETTYVLERVVKNIETLERFMIKKFRPTLNVIHNA